MTVSNLIHFFRLMVSFGSLRPADANDLSEKVGEKRTKTGDESAIDVDFSFRVC